MKTFFYCIVLLAAGLVLINCPSTPAAITPEPTPAETLAPTPTPEPTKTPTPVPTITIEPISQDEILVVQNAIARAEEVNAEKYAKTELEKAKTLLAEALTNDKQAPAAAREKLAAAKTAADNAYSASLQQTAADYDKKFKLQNTKLLGIAADKYRAKEYAALNADIQRSQSLYAEGKLVDAMNLAETTLSAMTELYSALDQQLKFVSVLKTDTEKNLASAEKYEAYVWTPDTLVKINEYYFLGINAKDTYKIDNAEEYFGYAKELSADMLVTAQKVKKQNEAQNLKNEVLNLLEESSRLNIVTEDGEVIEANPVDIEEFLKAIEAELENQKNSSTGSPQAWLNLKDQVLVLGEITSDNLLIQAKQLIRQGIIAEKNDDLDMAMVYYNQSIKYMQLYKAQSVSQIYTVKLVPERRDCLWRIAEKSDIYGDPFLWPLIWKRNRKQIQNPSLIQPGWNLIIPVK